MAASGTAGAMGLVLAGCSANVVFLEYLVKSDPGCGNLITFSSFLFITIQGFIFTTRCGTQKPKVPFRSWTTLVIMYFVVSVTNNYALNFHISMPLHMIFRAGSLIANMLMGMITLNRRYSTSKYVSVVMISVGIFLCTLMSAQEVKKESAEHVPESRTRAQNEALELLWWCLGIAMLTFALFLSARMGIYQEQIYSKYGKHPREALFYSHFLPLPGFFLLSKDIYTHFTMAMESSPIDILGFVQMPSTIFHLICNVLTQFICISAVFKLTSECTSLTVTLVVTLRKFISLLFSIWYFENLFTFVHWVGTVLVFGGTLLFSNVPDLLLQKLSQETPPTKGKTKAE